MVIHWNVRPERAPAILYSCSRCSSLNAFYCSSKFRVNANKKKIDVFLIYKCSSCNNTLNVPIERRAWVKKIPNSFLHNSINNNLVLAEKISFDYKFLRAQGYQTEKQPPYELEVISTPIKITTQYIINISVSNPIKLRLDRMLCKGLRVSREEFKQLTRNNSIAVPGHQRKIHKDVVITEPLEIHISNFEDKQC